MFAIFGRPSLSSRKWQNLLSDVWCKWISATNLSRICLLLHCLHSCVALSSPGRVQDTFLFQEQGKSSLKMGFWDSHMTSKKAKNEHSHIQMEKDYCLSIPIWLRRAGSDFSWSCFINEWFPSTSNFNPLDNWLKKESNQQYYSNKFSLIEGP